MTRPEPPRKCNKNINFFTGPTPKSGPTEFAIHLPIGPWHPRMVGEGSETSNKCQISAGDLKNKCRISAGDLKNKCRISAGDLKNKCPISAGTLKISAR